MKNHFLISDSEKSRILNLHESSKHPHGTSLLNEEETDESNMEIITNKIKSEGIKNVSDKMINSDPFKGSWSGYVFGGEFDGVRYQWDASNVDGMSGVRGFVEGVIHSHQNSALSKHYGINDADPNGVFVGFYDNRSTLFACYKSKSGKPKCSNIKMG